MAGGEGVEEGWTGEGHGREMKRLESKWEMGSDVNLPVKYVCGKKRIFYRFLPVKYDSLNSYQ